MRRKRDTRTLDISRKMQGERDSKKYTHLHIIQIYQVYKRESARGDERKREIDKSQNKKLCGGPFVEFR